MLIDSHCHLNFPALLDDLPGVLERAAGTGVERMVVIGTTVADSAVAVALAEAYPGRLFAAVGIHPHEAASLEDATLAELRRLAASPGVVAIGETGLDFYRNRAPEVVQRESFRRQIALARELELPLVIHSRAAPAGCDEVLLAEGGYDGRVVMHCFTTEPDWARRFAARGCWLSLGGPVTYPSADDARQIVREAPGERLMLETDSPYLAPQSVRGRRCEPAHLREVADAAARARGVAVDELTESTGAAAAAFFAWER